MMDQDILLETLSVKDEICDFDDEPVELISIENVDELSNGQDESWNNFDPKSRGIDIYKLQAEQENVCKLSSLRGKCIQLDINNMTAKELISDYVKIHNQDSYNSFGLYVAKQLNCLPRKVAVICQKLINEIICEAEIEMQWPFEECHEDTTFQDETFDTAKENFQIMQENCPTFRKDVYTLPEDDNNLSSTEINQRYSETDQNDFILAELNSNHEDHYCEVDSVMDASSLMETSSKDRKGKPKQNYDEICDLVEEPYKKQDSDEYCNTLDNSIYAVESCVEWKTNQLRIEHPETEISVIPFSEQCPICQNNVVKLNDHLRHHGIDKEERRLLIAGIRKPKKISMEGRRFCPFNECYEKPAYTRLCKHLRKFHKIEKSSPLYKKFTRSRVIKKTNNCPLLIAYENFLKTIEGGMLSMHCARDRTYKVRKIFNDIKLFDLSSVVSEEVLEKLQNWVPFFLESHEPTSVVIYLSSFLSFLKFVMCKEKDEDQIIFRQMQKKIFKWQKILRTQIGSFFHLNTDLNEEQINHFNESKLYKDAVILLKELKFTNRPITLLELTKIRNVLMLAALLRNSKKASLLIDMTVKEFTNAVCSSSEGRNFFVITVCAKITDVEQCPAELILSEDLHELLCMYMSVLSLQSNMEQISERLFFANWSGKKLCCNDVLTSFCSVWKMAGFSSRFSCISLRKKITNKIEASTNKEELMTSQINSRSCQLTEESEKIVNVPIKSQKDLLEKNEDSEQYQVSADISNSETSLLNLEISEIPLNSGVLDVSSSDAVLLKISKDSLSTPATSTYKGRGRSYFYLSERMLIKNVFISELTKKSLPTLKQIRKIVETDKRLQLLRDRKKDNATKIKGCLQGLLKHIH